MINAVNEFLDDLRGGRMSEAPIVRVEQGQLQGKVVNGPSGKAYFAFQGVPYAKPPLGSLRFKAPQPHEPWEGVRDATSEGNVSAQIDFVSKTYTGDENCLFLNIYTPTVDGAFLPVMVYIHGGGFIYGSGNSDFYGPDYLVEKDVVVVTLNYRLGVLGFLGLNTPEVPGNAGAKDVVQALRWIKENIHNFGGNAGNLTLFGESAGGGLVSMLTASPLSKSLIDRAIVQSGTALLSWFTQKTPVDNARKLAKALGCEGETTDEIFEFLSTTPAKDIVEAHFKTSPFDDVLDTVPNVFGLVVEKEFPGIEALTTEPFADLLKSGRVAQVPTMIGSNALEFAFTRKHDDLQIFIPEELHIERNSETAVAIAEELKKLYFKNGEITDREYYQLTSDRYINVDTHRYIQYLLHSSNIPVYFYKFDYVGELNVSKKFSSSLQLDEPMHLDELGYIFKTELLKDAEPTPQDEKMRERMVRLWTNFAKTGNPTPEETHTINVIWKPAAIENENYLHISQELTLDSNYDKEKMEFWDSLYFKYYKVWNQDTNAEPAFETPRSDPVIVETLTIVTTTSGSNSVETVTNLVEISSVETGEVVEIQEVLPPVVVETQDVLAPEVVETQEVLAPEVVETREEPTKVAETQESPEVPEPEVVDSPIVAEVPKIEEKRNATVEVVENSQLNGNHERSIKRTSNEIKMVQNSNGVPKDVIRANDPPEDDLPKNIGVNKFVNFFESLGGKK